MIHVKDNRNQISTSLPSLLRRSSYCFQDKNQRLCLPTAGVSDWKTSNPQRYSLRFGAKENLLSFVPILQSLAGKSCGQQGGPCFWQPTCYSPCRGGHQACSIYLFIFRLPSRRFGYGDDGSYQQRFGMAYSPRPHSQLESAGSGIAQGGNGPGRALRTVR